MVTGRERKISSLGHRAYAELNKTLVAGMAMYRQHGHREVPAFNDETFGDHWFEKDLVRER